MGSTHSGLEVDKTFIFVLFLFFFKSAFPPYVVFVSREGRPQVSVDRHCFVPYNEGWQPIYSCLEQVAKDGSYQDPEE